MRPSDAPFARLPNRRIYGRCKRWKKRPSAPLARALEVSRRTIDYGLVCIMTGELLMVSGSMDIDTARSTPMRLQSTHARGTTSSPADTYYKAGSATLSMVPQSYTSEVPMGHP